MQASVLNDIQQQVARKTDIVIYNLDESTNEEGSARKDQNITQLQSILETIGLSVGINIEGDVSTSRHLRKHPVTNSKPTSVDLQPNEATPVQASYQLCRDILPNAENYPKEISSTFL